MSALDGLIAFLAHLEGVTDAQLAEIEAALPATSKLVALSQKFAPILTKASPLVDELMPLYQQAKPLIAQAIAEWKTLAPALTIVLAVIAKKTKQGATLSQAVTSLGADDYVPSAEI